MKGCRALTADEVVRVSQAFHGTYAERDRALFILGIKTGFRISELLSLGVGDVWQAWALRRLHGGSAPVYERENSRPQRHRTSRREGRPGCLAHGAAAHRGGDPRDGALSLAERAQSRTSPWPGGAFPAAGLRGMRAGREALHAQHAEDLWGNRLGEIRAGPSQDAAGHGLQEPGEHGGLSPYRYA